MGLMEISHDLASTLDLDALLNAIVFAARDVTGSEAASILLYDEPKHVLYFQAATNIEDHSMKGLSVPVEGSIAGEVLTTREPIIVPSAKDNPKHFDKVGEIIQFQTDSILGVPLITKEKIIGVLEAINKKEGVFNEDDKKLLTAFGSQAAVAIENSRLFQQSDLIAEMVHELRTPLASISTASALLTRPEISKDQALHIAETIQKETARLSDLTTSFLDLARLESGRSQFKLESIDIRDVLAETIEIMRSRIMDQELILETNFPGHVPKINADSDKLKQVAINLISNSIKYNRPGGSITVGITDEKDRVSFYVKDTGRGMLPEHVESLFTKFYRIPGSENIAGGTGLGLSIVKKIVEGHGGQVNVDSQIGSGTTFTVSFPLNAETFP